MRQPLAIFQAALQSLRTRCAPPNRDDQPNTFCAKITVSFAMLFTFLMIPLPTVTSQELDESREHRSAITSTGSPATPLKAKLVWENVRNDDGYLCGIRPSRSLRFRSQTVKLEPGESTDFLVPAHQLIRVVGCGSKLTSNDVQIWTSNGSGLFRKQNACVSTDGTSLLAAPDQSGVSVAKVWRPENCAEAITVAIYSSRRRTPKLLDYYQCQILNCDEQVKISDDQGGSARNYVALPADVSKRVNAEEPTRIRLEARLKYGLDSLRRQTFWLRVYVDGTLDRILSFDTSPQKTNREFVDGCEQLVGRKEFAYLDFEHGHQKIEIVSSHPLFLRADGIGLDLCRPRNRSFDFPGWENSIKAISNWEAPQFDPGTAELSQSFLTDSDDAMAVPAIAPIWDPYLNLPTIQRIARHNETPHGGLRAYMWMRALATRHYDDADYGDEISISNMADRIREHYTMFRDILPTDLAHDSDPKLIGFFNRSIRKPNQKATETIIGEQHIGDVLSSMPKAQVFRMPANEAEPLRYDFSKDLGATMLRLVIDQSHLKVGSRVMVQYDDRIPIEFVVHKTEGAEKELFVPSVHEAALASLAQTHQRYDAGNLGGPFASIQEPTPIVATATAQFLKPADVKQVSIWTKAENDAQTNDAFVGLQYLDSRVTKLSESAYLNLISLQEQARNSNGSHQNEARFVSHELANGATDVRRVLQSHLKTFRTSIAESDQLQPAELWDADKIYRVNVEAMGFAEIQQWPAAIEVLSEIVNHSDGEQRRKAILARANALEAAGEFILADRERRGWMYYSDDPQLRREMLNQLIDGSVDNPDLQEMYEATAAISVSSPENELQLARRLMENSVTL